MSFYRVKIKLDAAKAIKKLKTEFMNEKMLKDIQAQVVDGEIKRNIAAGVSPVRGFGRFGEYVNPANYPGKGKKRLKPQRPVNLFLTGNMLKWFGTFKSSATSVQVGIDRNAPSDVKVRAKANNLGTERNGVGAIPRRRFIPQRGEQWNVSVMRKIKNLFAQRVKELLNK
jgi:hypothetical protein